MADFHIYIGYRTVSTWSMRGWLPLKKTGAPFEETLIRYRTAEGKARLAQISPTAKVPFLVHRRDGKEVKVWDSLAIGEYLAELFPERRLWPQDAAARAHARSISAEMHSGFRPLREHLSMALLERHPNPNNPQANADIQRIEKMWRECRETFGKSGGGPFLFGHWTIADAMYAPVVTRFRTHGVKLGATGAAYMEAVLADPDFKVWEDQARKDPPPEPQTD
ncbi:MAG: glutathione S-transferase family protein [Bauldia sp.]|nr:glutathione S-transferase family protein [Bauldia sp.]